MTQEQVDREEYARLMQMQNSHSYAGFSGRGFLIAAASIGLMIGGMMAFMGEDGGTDYVKAARNSWLTECQIKGRSSEECASSWDNGSTLRHVYYERARKEPAE